VRVDANGGALDDEWLDGLFFENMAIRAVWNERMLEALENGGARRQVAQPV
jgi:hypothetical protein